MTSLEIQVQVTIKVTRKDYKKVIAALTQHNFDWDDFDLIGDDIDDRRIAVYDLDTIDELNQLQQLLNTL